MDAIANTINILILLIFFAAFIVTIISFYRSYIIKNAADIINIEDLDMIVKRKSCYSSNCRGYTHESAIQWKVYLQDTNNKSDNVKVSVNLYDYDKLNKGEVVTVQRIFYKHKNKIYSEIDIANKGHYRRLQEYLNGDSEDAEGLISQSNKIRKISSPLYNKIMNVLVVSFVILWFLNILY